MNVKTKRMISRIDALIRANHAGTDMFFGFMAGVGVLALSAVTLWAVVL